MKHLPVSHPLRVIHAALCSALDQRNAMPPQQWVESAVSAVDAAVRSLSGERGITAPGRRDIEAAEVRARGAADYAATFSIEAWRLLEQSRRP